MKNSILKGILLVLFVATTLSTWSQTSMQASDLQYLASEDWKGELLYNDPETSNQIIVPVEMTATTSNNRTFVFSYHYPDNPKADNMVQFKVNSKYSKISSNKIVERKELGDEIVEVTTSRKGKDNHKKAMLYYVYTFGPNTFSLSTEVKYLGQGDRVIRSRFTFKR